jgi:NitT/TauT family transport system permease protein
VQHTDGDPPATMPEAPIRRMRFDRNSRVGVLAAQLLVLAVFLAAWQWLPTIDALSHRTHLLDSFFISSPSKIFQQLVDLVTGHNDSVKIWPYLWPTIVASLGGLVIGAVTGGAVGLILGSSEYLSRVFTPFVVAVNAIPRIALIPIVVIVVGPTLKASIIVSVMIVFFVVLFNANEGAKSPPAALLQNARIMGASGRQIMLGIRAPYAGVWVIAALPVSATFSIIAVVTAELITGYNGLGRLVSTASSTADSTLTFAVVVVLSALGLVVVGLTSLMSRRVLHWWADGRA